MDMLQMFQDKARQAQNILNKEILGKKSEISNSNKSIITHDLNSFLND
jgi:hypothetical protein